MGSKNCPETPRQKMIGMMYLVLTAMLALNVSADVLEAFTEVQVGLASSINGLSRKNAELYNDIEMAYNLNRVKVRKVRDKAMELRKQSYDLYQYVEELKQRMAVMADGEEADIYNLQGKDNLDIGGQVMVLERKGQELKEKIAAYRQLLTGYVAPKDTVFLRTVLARLNTDDPEPIDGEFKSWESAKFESMPLVGVMTLLSMYQSDFLSVESDMLHYLHASIDAESFKFNKLEALVIPDSRYILKGDVFKARILLAATDTTQHPEILVNGREVGYQGDYAFYSQPATTAGVQKISGVINYLTPSGAMLPKKFETSYMVADPAVVVSPTKMNVFYVGVDNPVAIAAPGMSLDEIDAQVTNGVIRKVNNGNYIVRPKVVGKECVVSVFGNIGGTKRALQNYHFRVKDVPDPVAKVNGQRGGSIRKNVLLAAGQVEVVMENFDFDMKFTVENFSVYSVIDGYVQEETQSDRGAFSKAQLNLIRKLRRNQAVTIENIIVKGADGTTRKLPPVSFKLE